uniref:hypothetical protein n=1 Tax=Stappia sp. TaxID=1870903 RepID=UPI003BA86E15
MADEDKKASSGDTPANTKAGGRAKASGRKAAPERDGPERAGPSDLDLQRLQVELEQARFAREQDMRERCGAAGAELGALHAEVQERLAERGAELQQEMMELWQRVQSQHTALWQAQYGGAAMEAEELREISADIAKAQLRIQALQATLCNLSVLDPEASKIWFEGLTRDADIRGMCERDMEALGRKHAENVSSLLSGIETDDLHPAARMQVETLRSWYASG